MKKASTTTSRFLKFANRPPLGWNSYDCFGSDVTEAEIRENAEAFARRLKPAGWEYVVVDFCWSHPAPGPCANPNIGAGHQPLLHCDRYGRLIPAPNRFPSSANSQGFKPLADFVHGLGLKFGIHIMRGYPRSAFLSNPPIEGSPYRARDAVIEQTECTWLDHMFTVDAGTAAGRAYYDSIFRLYASWEVDFVKVDDILADGTDRGLGPYHAAEIEAIREAIDKCGRPMVVSLSPGDAPISAATHLQNHANMWRMSSDFWDDWEKLKRMFTLCQRWWPHRKPGAWPDADMLPLGRLCKRGPKVPERDSWFTPAESRTLMTLWSIFGSPLMMGGHLPETDDATFSMLTNPEVLEVNQHCLGGQPLAGRPDELPVWVSKYPRSKDIALALFNLSDRATRVGVEIKDLGLTGRITVRDLWARADLRAGKAGRLTARLAPHDAALFRVTTN